MNLCNVHVIDNNLQQSRYDICLYEDIYNIYIAVYIAAFQLFFSISGSLYTTAPASTEFLKEIINVDNEN